MTKTDNLKQLIKEDSFNFTKNINTSTLMVGDNYHSGEVKVNNKIYYFAKYRNKVKVWDRKADYMDLVNNAKDFLYEYLI